MDIKNVTLRCDDGLEAVVFNKYSYGEKYTPSFEINVEDSYVGKGYYRGVLGRLRRAFTAFVEPPVIYTGICCEDKAKIKKFLTDCLELLDEEA